VKNGKFRNENPLFLDLEVYKALYYPKLKRYNYGTDYDVKQHARFRYSFICQSTSTRHWFEAT